MPPSAYAPTSQADQPEWPKWGQYYETRGGAGEAPDLPEAKRLLELFEQWKVATAEDAQAAAWHQMLELYADQCFTLGLMSGAKQPVAARRTLHNLPQTAIYGWEPYAQFGAYLPDTFWYGD